MNEMSGATAYQKNLKVAGYAVNFYAEPTVTGKIEEEGLGIQDVSDTFDVRKHRDVAAKILGAVYGASVANDFKNAKQVAEFGMYGTPVRTTLLKGKLFAYQLTAGLTNIMTLHFLPAALKLAKQCEKMECGD